MTTSHRSCAALIATAAALAALAFLMPQEAEAGPGKGGDFGLGIIVGGPTGLTAKGWLGPGQAVQGHLAFDLRDDDFNLNVDYLFHFDVFNARSVDLPLYVGIGGKLGFHDHNDHHHRHRDDDTDISLGIRIPLGIALLLRSAPLEFFLEVVPGLRLVPGTSGFLDAGIGARYYF